MKCVNCSEEIIKSLTGWRSASKPHRSICDSDDDNSKHHEPEPTEAAPLCVNPGCELHAFERQALARNAEREAVVGGQPQKFVFDDFCETCSHEAKCSIKGRCVKEMVRGERDDVTHIPECPTCHKPYVFISGIYRPTRSCSCPIPQPETPRPEMGKEWSLQETLVNVSQLLSGWHQDGTTWSEWDELVRQNVSRHLVAYKPEPIIECPQCGGDPCKDGCTAWAATSGTESAPNALPALKRLYEETADYIRVNNLGDVHHNQAMKDARDVLASSLTQAGPPKEKHPTYGELLRCMRGYVMEQKACGNPARMQDLKEFRQWKNMPQNPSYDAALLQEINGAAQSQKGGGE